jgi:putative SbcD/Mre11-related phosphoesterase
VQPWIDVGGGIRVTGTGAAWLPAERTVVVADVHVGYELAAGRRGGYLPPVASGHEIGLRVAQLATALGASRLVIAGDLRHSTRDVDALERDELAGFAAAVRRTVTLDVVLGNHDRGDALVDVAAVHALRVGEVDVVHHPPSTPPERWTICGHLHPRLTLRDETGASARYPCAMVGPRIVIVPAFSDWAGGTEARRLLDELPSGSWRALPMVDGMIADVGMVLERG